MYNSKMIILARELAGMSQSQLSKEIHGLTQGYLSKIEKGLVKTNSEVLEQISKRLNVPTSFFYQENSKIPISEFYYRKRVYRNKSKLRKSEATLNTIRLIFDHLSDSIELPELALPNIDISDSESPEWAAGSVRKSLGVGDGPIIDLTRLIEKAGLPIVEINTNDEKFDGIILVANSGQPILFINGRMPNDRKRWTIAHEVGHLILHVKNIISENRDVEKEANRFAGEFLMPKREALRDLIGITFSKLPALKKYWRISMAALIYRGIELNVLSQTKGKNFRIEMSRRGWRKIEPIVVELDKPQILQEIINLYFEELNYSKEDLSTLIKYDFDRFYSLLSLRDKTRIVSLV